MYIDYAINSLDTIVKLCFNSRGGQDSENMINTWFTRLESSKDKKKESSRQWKPQVHERLIFQKLKEPPKPTSELPPARVAIVGTEGEKKLISDWGKEQGLSSSSSISRKRSPIDGDDREGGSIDGKRPRLLSTTGDIDVPFCGSPISMDPPLPLPSSSKQQPPLASIPSPNQPLSPAPLVVDEEEPNQISASRDPTPVAPPQPAEDEEMSPVPPSPVITPHRAPARSSQSFFLLSYEKKPPINLTHLF